MPPGSMTVSQTAPPTVQPVAVPEAVPGLTTARQAAHAVFQTHCARCHDKAQRTPEQPATALQTILDIEGLEKQPGLVQPGRPDASNLYAIMLRDHTPLQLGPANLAPDDVDAVRTWIEGVAARPVENCTGRRRITLADIGRALQRLRQPGGTALRGIRFISLAAYHNACAGPGRMEDLRRAVGDLVTALRTTLVDFDLPQAGDDVPVLAVRLGDMGWNASQWDALATIARAPHLATQDLAEAYDTETPLIDVASLAAAAWQVGDYPNLANVSPLAQSFIADGRAEVGFAAAAQDVGLPELDFAALLETTAGPADGYAKRLRQGAIPRAAWHRLRAGLTLPGEPAALRYRADVPAAADPVSDAALHVGLWTDKATYKVGDLIVLTAQADRDCNLTLVNVDTRGDATILFPSDSDPDNAVKAGAKIRVPGDIEPYQLRANEAGTETFIAVCSVHRKRMLGVEQDFEKQRFTLLGNWRNYLKTAATRETLVGRRDTPRQRRARAKADAAAKAAPPPAEQEARAAIYVRIE